jgi:hypothetical protein
LGEFGEWDCFDRAGLAMAGSTLVHAVFWTRTAPTMISKRVRPGHQFCGP